MLAIFFKFNRVWSVRNFDLICLIFLTPGLLLIASGNTNTGYVWLFCVQGVLVVRLLLDNIMVRRPLLEPNLSWEGLSFACFFLVFFLIAALLVHRGERVDTVNTLRLEQILTARHIHDGIGMNPDSLTIPQSEWDNMPPGFRPFIVLTERANLAFAPPSPIQHEIIQKGQQANAEMDTNAGTEDATPPMDHSEITEGLTPPVLSPSETLPIDTAPVEIESEELASIEPAPADSAAQNPELSTWLLILTLIIAGHLVIVFQFAYIGYRHFGRLQTGIACAALYLFHPYSAQMIGRLDHIIPTALLLWSVLAYRRPFFAGLGIGAAAALVWYPFWLIPLWCSFYWQKGWIRFLSGTATALLVFAVFLLFSLPEWGTFREQLIHMAGATAFLVFNQQPVGFWSLDDIYYRMPILALFFVICFGALFVPSHKHLATLLCGSALLMLSVQFFQLYQGGLYLSWYLPLLILTIFRPNLEDRTARTVVV